MRWLIVVAVIIVVLILYSENAEQPATTAAQTTTTQAPEPEETQTPTPTPAPRRHVQAAAPDKLALMQQIARKNRVDIAGLQNSGSRATLRIQWYGNSTGPGGDFVRECLREGVFRDVNLPGPNEQGFMIDRQQRRMFWVQYQIVW